MTNSTTANLKPSHLNILAKMSEIRNLNQIRETLQKALYAADLESDVFESLANIDLLISNARAELKTL